MDPAGRELPGTAPAAFRPVGSDPPTLLRSALAQAEIQTCGRGKVGGIYTPQPRGRGGAWKHHWSLLPCVG